MPTAQEWSNVTELILYSLLFVFTIVIFALHLRDTSPPRKISAQLIFHIIAILACLLKLVSGSIGLVSNEAVQFVVARWQLVWIAISEILVFLAYTILLIFFAETHSHSRLKGGCFLRCLFITANVIFDAGCLVICAFMIWIGSTHPDPSDPDFALPFLNCFIALACFFKAMNLFTAGGFVFYGRRLAEYLKNFPMGSMSAKHASARRVKIYAVTCAVCFGVRAMWTLTEVLTLSGLFEIPSFVYVICLQLFIVLPEWSALMIMLLWMRFRTMRGQTVSTTQWDVLVPAYSTILLKSTDGNVTGEAATSYDFRNATISTLTDL